MPSSPGRNRKTLLVNRPYQTRVLLKILLVVILATLSSTAAVYFLTGREIERSFFVIHRGISDMRALLLPVLVISAAATLLALSILAAYTILRETHRVVGPAKRMEAKFLQMAEGDFALMPPFRRDDVLKGLDDYVNLHLNNMSDYFTCLDRSLADLKVSLAKLKQGENPDGEAVARITGTVKDIEAYAAAFRKR